MTPEEAKQTTIEIFRIILHEMNGYDKSEIIDKNLAEDCETDISFTQIEELLLTK